MNWGGPHCKKLILPSVNASANNSHPLTEKLKRDLVAGYERQSRTKEGNFQKLELINRMTNKEGAACYV